MNRTLLVCATVSLLLAASVVALADLAAPRPAPSQPPPPKYLLNTGFAVVPDSKAYQARLEISQSALKELQASLASLPVDSSTAGTRDNSITGSISGSSTRTIVAGMFLFLSLSCAGVWLARGTSARGQKIAAVALLGAAVVGAAAIIARGNIGPPPSINWRNLSRNLNEGKTTQASVDIEVVAEGRGIRLVIPVPAKRNGDE